MKLKSMKISAKERKADQEKWSKPISPDGGEYPYGLRLTLDDKTLKKLGIDELPEVGEYITLEAECCVVSTSQNKNTGRDERRLELQIEKLGCEEDDDEDESAEDAVSKAVDKARDY